MIFLSCLMVLGGRESREILILTIILIPVMLKWVEIWYGWPIGPMEYEIVLHHVWRTISVDVNINLIQQKVLGVFRQVFLVSFHSFFVKSTFSVTFDLVILGKLLLKISEKWLSTEKLNPFLTIIAPVWTIFANINKARWTKKLFI